MIIPIRCFSCGKLIATKWVQYSELVANDVTVAQALDRVGLTRVCCRRMFISHVELIDDILLLENYQIPVTHVHESSRPLMNYAPTRIATRKPGAEQNS